MCVLSARLDCLLLEQAAVERREREGLTRRGSADLTPLRLVKCLHLFRLICVRQRERLPLHWAISTCVLVPPLDPTLTSHLAGARTDTNASEA